MHQLSSVYSFIKWRHIKHDEVFMCERFVNFVGLYSIRICILCWLVSRVFRFFTILKLKMLKVACDGDLGTDSKLEKKLK